MGVGCGHHQFQDFFVRDSAGSLHFFAQWQVKQPLFSQHLLEAGQVPLLLDRFSGDILANQVRETPFTQSCDLAVQLLGVQNVIALLVDHLALVVRHVVVFEQLFADIEIARLHFALGAFDAARDDARFDGLAFRHLQAVHDGAHAITGKNAHERVVQAQVKAR